MSARVKRKTRRAAAAIGAAKRVAELEAMLADAHARRLNAEQEKERGLAEERKTTLRLLNEQTMLRSQVEDLERQVSDRSDLERAAMALAVGLDNARAEAQRLKAEVEKLSAEDRDAAKLRRRLRNAGERNDELLRRLNRAEAALAEYRRTTVVLPVRRGAA
jgi:predicted RNase H-like nuclease (RuvC/YqgF family)